MALVDPEASGDSDVGAEDASGDEDVGWEEDEVDLEEEGFSMAEK